MQRTAMAVDISNIYCQLKENQTKGDYGLLRKWVYGDPNTEPWDDVGSMVFAPLPDPRENSDLYGKTSAFQNRLRHLGYMVYTKTSRNNKSNVDVAMTVKTMEFCHQAKPDLFVLVTGDGDFVPLATHLREMGIRVRAAAFREVTSGDLIAACNDFVDLKGWAAESFPGG